ncbi:MAG: hypothetical protein MZU91_14625 [Desulfosudis oleivorans]|nr:hypothetical protein [Desulfosudis oleivorans]
MEETGRLAGGVIASRFPSGTRTGAVGRDQGSVHPRFRQPLRHRGEQPHVLLGAGAPAVRRDRPAALAGGRWWTCITSPAAAT